MKVFSGSATITNGVVRWNFDSPFSTILGAVAVTYGTSPVTLTGVKVNTMNQSYVDFFVNYIESGSSAIKYVTSGTVILYAIAYGV